MKVTRRIRVSGNVQGVGYRYFCKLHAAELGITGSARNLSDGSVEVWASGETPAIETFTGYLQEGPSFAGVTNLEIENTEKAEEFAGFTTE